MACSQPGGGVRGAGRRSGRPRVAGSNRCRGCRPVRLVRLTAREATNELIGRERELALIGASIGDLARGRGSVLVIEGPAGTGKSSLLQAVTAADDALRARAVPLDTAVPLGVAGRLLGAAIAATDSPTARAGEKALGREIEPAGQPAATREATQSLAVATEGGAAWLDALSRATAEIAEMRGGCVIALDDLQWADPQSIQLVLYLAALAAELPALVAVAVRGRELPEATAQLCSMPEATHLRLDDLGGDDAGRLAAQRLPGADPELLAACCHASGGNPFLLVELAASIASERRAGQGLSAAVAEMAPKTVIDQVLIRLAGLSDSAVTMARAVAVLGDGVPMRHAAKLAELDPPSAAVAADALVEDGILAVGGDGIEFRHPLLADAVLRDLGTFSLERWYRSAAEMLSEEGLQERAAACLLRASGQADPASIEVLRSAAGAALSRGDAETAAKLLARALEEPPAPDDRPAILRDLAVAEAASGNPASLEHLDEALRLESDPAKRALAARDLARLHHLRLDFATATALAERALAELPPGHPDRDRTQATWQLAAGMNPDTYSVSVEATQRLAEAALDGKLPSNHELQAVTALHLACTGQPELAVEIAERSVAGYTRDSAPEDLSVVLDMALGALIFAGRPRLALRCADAVEATDGNGDSLLRAASTACGRGMARLELGDLDGAEDDAQTALVPGRYGWTVYTPQGAALLAHTRLERDDVAGARAALQLTSVPIEAQPILAYAEGCVALAEGRAEQASSAFSTAGTALREIWRIETPVVVPWRAGLALARHREGDHEQARTLATTAVELARETGVNAVLARAMANAGTVVGGSEGIALLRDAEALTVDDESARDRIRTRVALGSALRRDGARSEARSMLARAREEAEALGLTALSARAVEEQRSSGARPRRTALSGVAALTPGELRIAKRAAQGMTNREIASELFLTSKTVGWHMSNVLRKLEISSRRSLPEELTADD